MNVKELCILLLLLAVVGCVTQGVKLQKEVSKKTFLTQDGQRISYTFWEGSKDKGVILLHMLNKNRKEYDEFAKVLNIEGYPVLSFDFRGHGESDGNWQEFSPKQFKDMTLDVKAAAEFFVKKGIGKLILVGASIGANVALVQAEEDPVVQAVIALSPGLEYRGIQTEEAVKKISIPVLYIASKEDEYAALSAQRLYNLTRAPAHIVLYDNAGHGTQLLAQKGILESILQWVNKSQGR